MKYKLSKKLITWLIEKENHKNNIEINISPVNNIEYILKILKKDIKENIITKKTTFGLWDGKNILILLTNIAKNSGDKYTFLYKLVQTAYHEYNHALVLNDTIKKDEFVKYGIQLGEILFLTSNCYKKHHDEFWIEILANDYSIEKTIEFMKKHPNTYQQSQYDIDLNKIYYQIYSQNYDPQQQINYISKIIKNKDKRTVNMYFKEIDTLPKLFTKEGIPKPQTDLSDKDFYINYIIVSSKAYLDKIDYNICEPRVLKILLKSLNYTYDIETTRYEKNEQLKKIIIEKDTNIKKITNNPYIIYYQTLLPLLEQKQKRVENKLKYLELEITKINLILNEKTDNKKLIRKQNA